MSETANRNIRANRSATRALLAGMALFVGVIVPFLGYVTLLGSHENEDHPSWVYAAIPAALVGPDIPSLAQFAVLAIVNIVLWFSVTYWAGKGLVFVLGMFHRRK